MTVHHLSYPGRKPGPSKASLSGESATLENAVLTYQWRLSPDGIRGLSVTNKDTRNSLAFQDGFLPRIVFRNGPCFNLADAVVSERLRLNETELSATFRDEKSGLAISFSVALEEGMNAVIHTLEITATQNSSIEDIVFLDAPLPKAEQAGEVMGSVVLSNHIFMGVEHPMAKNIVSDDGNVCCSLPRSGEIQAGTRWIYTFVIGVTPRTQLRRGFGYYIDRRRAHPYRPYLHYNNWYDVWLERPVNQRMTEKECLDAIHYFGRELVRKRQVKMDAVVWDDGWDDFKNSLWGFHSGFPDGFKNLMNAAREYGMDQGVWLSPKGGYAYAKEARISHCRPLGYEINEGGFSMAGPHYFKAFLDICLRMIRENGVSFFKFDSLGDGGQNTGKKVKLSDDVNATLEIIRQLREEKKDVYISATAGTWASPYWLLYADNIWRQGGDSGHHGGGDTRQSWITYRDMFTYNCVVKAGPLYPLNSLMLHGIMIGNRKERAPGTMVMDEKSVADEAWTFFGSGTGLQELYISPGVPTETMLDNIAAAANWSHTNAEVLVDTHWVGGNPEYAEVYGWASWQPRKGILVLRNPSDDSRTFATMIRQVLELPEDEATTLSLNTVYSHGCEHPRGPVSVDETITFSLQPWEVVVLELIHP